MSTTAEGVTGQTVATLVFPEDYLRQLNSVASVTTEHVVQLKRKFASRAGWQLVPIPLTEFTSVEYRDEVGLARIVWGVLLVALVLFIFVMLFIYWSDLEPGTRLPVGLVALGGLYGAHLALGGRRHRFIFVKSDGSKLTWKSRPGDHGPMKPLVDKLIAFARGRGLMH